MKFKIFTILTLFAFAKPSFAQDQFVAEIKIFAGNFAPKGWAKCEGQILSIAQNTALFSLLGTTYGGDGKTTFALPDLRERVVISPGQGPGLSNYSWGEKGGVTPLVLLPENLPAHTHSAGLEIGSSSATSTVPTTATTLGASSQLFNNNSRSFWLYTNTAGNLTMNSPSFTISSTGNSTPIQNRQPYLVCNYIIALQGIYPPRQ